MGKGKIYRERQIALPCCLSRHVTLLISSLHLVSPQNVEEIFFALFIEFNVEHEVEVEKEIKSC